MPGLLGGGRIGVPVYTVDTLTERDIAKAIDHSLLRPELDDAFVEEGIRLAAEYDVASVCVPPVHVRRAAAILAGTDVKVGTVVGFPHGYATTETKVAETRQALADGATEIDMVIQIGALRSGRDADVGSDIAAVVEAAHAGGAIVKVIFENAYLTDDQKVRASRLTEAAGAEFVKTSTGFAPSGATHDDLRLMRASTSPHVACQGRRRGSNTGRAPGGHGPRHHAHRGHGHEGDHRRLPGPQGRRGTGQRRRCDHRGWLLMAHARTTDPATSPAVVPPFLAEAQGLLDRLAGTQADALELASQWCAEAIAGDGLVHLFGTGHSRIPLEEMFPRYGSYPGFNPIAELSMTFHTQIVGANGQRQAMFIERMPGLAEVILSNFSFRPREVMIVFSASGLSAVPVEMARGARRRGLRVIAVTSVEQSMSSEPDPVVGTRLLDEADLVIDLCTPHADALVSIEGLDTPVGPGSTITAVAIVNSIKVRTAQLLVERGAMPPVITRASVVGAERSRSLFEQAYEEHARRIARAIIRDTDDDAASPGQEVKPI